MSLECLFQGNHIFILQLFCFFHWCMSAISILFVCSHIIICESRESFRFVRINWEIVERTTEWLSGDTKQMHANVIIIIIIIGQLFDIYIYIIRNRRMFTYNRREKCVHKKGSQQQDAKIASIIILHACILLIPHSSNKVLNKSFTLHEINYVLRADVFVRTSHIIAHFQLLLLLLYCLFNLRRMAVADLSAVVSTQLAVATQYKHTAHWSRILTELLTLQFRNEIVNK